MKKRTFALLVVSTAFIAQSSFAQIGPGTPPETRPQFPAGFEAPDFDQINALKEEARVLREAAQSERQAVLDALADDASLEEKKAALEAWRGSSDTIAQLKVLRESLKDAIGERPRFVPRERREIFRDRLKKRRDLRGELRSRLEGVEDEAERQQIIDGFREDVKALMEQRREERRAEIEAENNGGDSRNNS